MTAAARQEITLLALALIFTACAVSIALWGRTEDSTDTLFELLRAGAFVSWIVLAIVIGTHRVVKQVRSSASQISAEVAEARALAMGEIRRLYEQLGDKVAAKEFERRITEAEQGHAGSLAYLHDHGLKRGTQQP